MTKAVPDIASEFNVFAPMPSNGRRDKQRLQTGAVSRRRSTKDHQRMSRGGPMNRCTSAFAILAFGTFCTSSTIAMAAHSTTYSAPDKSVVFLGGVGYTWLKGNELFYVEVGNRISKLIWETGAPVLTTGLKAEVWKNWTISANGVLPDRIGRISQSTPTPALTATSTLTWQQAQTS
ncbi:MULTISPECIES: hypothetical protein [unclassified Mesorhizobium]|uniref:hypothetical protein n=1 Tax=unclassified Mesorhizobium TaxID=325217 RepID=UPI001FDFBBAF|nr:MULTISPECIES: hypothetical protein [unclassified Mesorhizobium]